MFLYILIILSIFLVYFYNSESFSNLDYSSNNNFWNLLDYGKSSSNCYSLDSSNCLNYNNCGLCYDGYSSKCIPGDYKGPFFHYGCNNWLYKDYIGKKIFDQNYTIRTKPWYHHYSDYEFRYPQTNTIFNL